MLAPILVAACSWASPGANPYQGDVPSAVHSYTDIPAPVRARLAARMEKRAYDDIATITRDSIQGAQDYAPELRDMHFGRRTVCGYPDRSKWTDKMVERGLVYCEAEHCLIVPTVCRNVSRVTRVAKPAPQLGPTARAAPGATLGPVEPETSAVEPFGAVGPGFAFPMPVPTPEQALAPGPTLSDAPSLYAVPFAQLFTVPYYAPIPALERSAVFTRPALSVPEPSTALLAILGLMALALARR